MHGTCYMLSVKIVNCGEISLGEKVESFTNAEENVTSLGLSTVTRTRKICQKNQVICLENQNLLLILTKRITVNN